MIRDQRERFHLITHRAMVIAIIISLIHILPLNFFMMDTVSGATSWLETTDTDFKAGTMDNLTINETGTASKLILSDYDDYRWIDKQWSWESPAARDALGMAYVDGTDKVVLFGGWNGATWLNDTWIYDLSEDNWTRQTPNNSPPRRHRSSMASINGTDKVLLFGGRNEYDWLNDTWVYDLSDNNWINLPSTTHPSARNAHAIASVYSDDKVLLFGGWGSAGFNNDTWIFDLSDGNWSEQAPHTKPSGREWHGLAEISGTDNFVLFGGRSLSESYNDTWLYDLSEDNWTKRAPNNHPNKTYSHRMASIYGTDRVLLFGGSEEKNETWEYDLSEDNWTQKFPPVFPWGRKNHALSTIYGTENVLLFGGSVDGDETWVYNASNNTWNKKVLVSRPSARFEHGMATLFGTDKVLLFGGNDGGDKSDETWLFDLSENNWTRPKPINTPTGRFRHAMAGIYGTDNVLLYGGNDGWICHDTWVYNLASNNWTEQNPNTSPISRTSHAMAPIYGTDKVLLFGGNDGSYNDETWVYDLSEDNWTDMSPILSPSARLAHSMSAIYGTDQVLLFGGNDGAADNETWLYNLTTNTWINQSPAISPNARSSHSMAPLNGTDKVMLFGGLDYWGNNGETWIYDLSENNWTIENLKLNPSARTAHRLATIDGTNKLLLFGGIDWARDDETWFYEFYIPFRDNGTYISKPYEVGENAEFLTLSWQANTPLSTEVKFQLRSATSESGLSAKSFVGLSGAPALYYTTSPSTIWSGHNGDTWIQYKAYLSTADNVKTPFLNSVTLTYNYLPKTSLVSPVNGYLMNNNKPLFAWSFSDSDSISQSAFQIRIDDDPAFNSIDFDSGEQNSFVQQWQFPAGTGYSVIPDGDWYWQVRTKDSDGSWGAYNSSFIFTIDTVRPSSTVTYPINNIFYNKIKSISGSASDSAGGSGVNKVELTIERLSDNSYWDGTAWQGSKKWLSTTGKNNWVFNSSSVAWISGEKYGIQSRTTDIAKNVELPSSQVTINFDSAAPTSSINNPIDNVHLNGLEVISGSALDTGGAGISEVRICIKQQSNNNYWSGSSWVSSTKWLIATGTTSWSYNTDSIPWVSGVSYLIQTKAIDNQYNAEVPGPGCTFMFDTDLPQTTIQTPANNSILRKLDTISGIADDTAGAGISGVEICIEHPDIDDYWNGSGWVSSETWLPATGTDSWSYDSSGVFWSSGTQYIIRSRASDNADNVGFPSNGIVVRIDKAKPTSKIGTPEPGSVLNSLNTISGSASDTDGAGLAKVELSIKSVNDDTYWSGSTWVSSESWLVVSGTKTWSYDPSTITWQSGTQYQIKSRATDNVQNLEVPGIGLTIKIDQDEPASKVETPNPDSQLNKLDSISGSAIDTGGAGISKVEVCIESVDDDKYWDGTSWVASESWLATVGSGEWSYDCGIVPWTTDLEYRIRSRAVDSAGNMETPGSGNIFLFDNKAPEELSIIINDDSKLTNSTLVTLKVGAIDTGSGVAEMAFSTDNVKWTSCEPFASDRAFTLPPMDGEKFIYFKVRDKVGNTADSVFDSIILDTSSPYSLSITINSGAPETNSTLVFLNLSALDEISDISQICFSFDGFNWSSWEPFINEKLYTLPENDGEKSVYFKVKDVAGNEATPVFAKIVLNTTVPDGGGVVKPGPSKSDSKDQYWLYLAVVIIIIIIILVLLRVMKGKPTKEELSAKGEELIEKNNKHRVKKKK